MVMLGYFTHAIGIGLCRTSTDSIHTLQRCTDNIGYSFSKRIPQGIMIIIIEVDWLVDSKLYMFESIDRVGREIQVTYY